MKTQKQKTKGKSKPKSIKEIVKPIPSKGSTRALKTSTPKAPSMNTLKAIDAAKKKAFGPVEMMDAKQLLYVSGPFAESKPSEILALRKIIEVSGKIDPLVVNRRKNGKYYIIDGRKRHLSLVDLPEHSRLPVQVAVKTLSSKEEQAWCDILQHTRRSTSTEARHQAYANAASILDKTFEDLVVRDQYGKVTGSTSLSWKELANMTGIPANTVRKDIVELKREARKQIAKKLSPKKRDELKRIELKNNLDKQILKRQRLEMELKEVNITIKELQLAIKRFH